MADIQKLTYPYFTDGSTQLNAQNLNPIISKMNEMIDAINSGVTPTPTQTVATPTISISGTTATISCSTSGATIYYTLNGNTPTTSSTQYSSPITLSGACTIKAIAVKSGMNNSSVASQSYTPSVVATPVISISGTSATITCATSGATIRYTLDGTTPTASSTQYSSPITLSGACTIKAIAVKSGMTTSQVAQETYSPSISPEAQAALAKFSNLSSAQQTKVKNLVDTLVSGGIYSKIHYLSFPTMAANVPEAVQNILSNVTPPTVESGVVNNGLYTEELVNLTDLLVGNIDYDNYSLAYSVQLNAEQTGNTATIMRLNSEVSGTASRIYQNVNESKIYFTGYKANGHPIAVDSTSAVFTQIDSHDKSNSVEKWFDVNGQLKSNTDGDVTPTNNGLSINTSVTATTYNVKFVGKYRFIMLSDCLTDAQLNTLKTAIDTFLS